MELTSLLQSLQFSLPEAEQQEVRLRLEQYISYLIANDFTRLVQLLYTVDVPEQKLKRVLLQQPERDAAPLITELILSRQEEKARSRQYFEKLSTATDDEERW